MPLLLLLVEIFQLLVDLDPSFEWHLKVKNHQVDRLEGRQVSFLSLRQRNFENLFGCVDCLLSIDCQCCFTEYSLLNQQLLYQGVTEELIIGKYNLIDVVDNLRVVVVIELLADCVTEINLKVTLVYFLECLQLL